jgi:ABC-type uncharacterized transport system permease subunit
LRIRIVQRDHIAGGKAALIRVIAIVLSFLVAAILLGVMGYNPWQAFGSLFKSAFGSMSNIRSTIITAIPLIIISLGVAIAFHMGYVNVGGEGQLLAGAVVATFISHNLPTSLPKIIMLLAMAAGSLLGGMLIAVIPAYFKAKFGVNETLFTLMLNYVMQYYVLMLRTQTWKDPKAMGFPKIAAVPNNAILPKVFGIHIGWIIAIILVVLVSMLLRRTKIGYEIRVVGASVNTARYAGMDVNRVILIGICMSGAIAGLTGMVKLSGTTYNLSESIGGGSGFTAVIIAWLAKLSPVGILIVGFLFGALTQGAVGMELALGIPAALAESIQGLILFGTLGCEFFVNYRLVREYPSKATKEAA